MDIRHAVGVKVGIPPATLEALGEYRTSPAFTERERAALEFAEEIVRDDREVSDAGVARLGQHFADAEIVELVFVVGYQAFAGKFAKAFRLAPQGFAGRPLTGVS